MSSCRTTVTSAWAFSRPVCASSWPPDPEEGDDTLDFGVGYYASGSTRELAVAVAGRVDHRDVRQNQRIVARGDPVIDAYEAAGQGVPLGRDTRAFRGFVDVGPRPSG